MSGREWQNREEQANAYEASLLDACTAVGYIAEMNGPSTRSFAAWVRLMSDDRKPEDHTIRELLALLERWKEWQARLFEEQKKTSNQKPETMNPNTENPAQ